jgi:hypothetical protein
MYARIIVIGFRPDALPVAAERYRSVSGPLIREWPGFMSAMGLAQWTTGKAMTVSIWETAEQRDESGLRLDYVQNLSSYGDMITGSVNRESYVVDFTSLRAATPEDAMRQAWARVTTLQMRPESWDDALAMLRPMAANDEGTGSDYHGTLLLTNRILSKAIAIGVWANRRAISQTDDEVHAQAYLIRRAGCLTVSPVHDVFEIVGWF